MLETKEVEVKLHPSNVKHYEDLGYPIPRVKNNQGNLVVPRGSKIIVKVQDLQPASNVMVEYYCDYCGEKKQIMFCDYIRKKSKKDCCIDCLGKYKSELNKIQWEDKLNSDVKVCSKCKRELPRTLEYFRQDKYRPDRLTSQCKECIDNKEIFNVEKEIILEGYKKCVDCGEVLEINESNFNKSNKSSDGFYNVCIKCQIIRRRNGADEGYKKCKSCNNTYPLTRDYFQPNKKCLDGYRNMCWKCIGRDFFPDIAHESWLEEDINIIKDNYIDKSIKDIITLLSVERTEKSILHIAQKLNLRKINSFVENYDIYKYKFINNILHKYCKGCNRYLPCNLDYFPKDKTCTDSLRNVCRECKEENFKVDSNVHVWTDEETAVLIKYYPHMTNNELYNTYLQNINIDKIIKKANRLGLYKTEETLKRCSQEVGLFHSNRLLEINKWVGDDNPQYNSQRFGELNPNYKGGISSLYQELRRNINQWKFDSMENCNYKCILTGKRFDVVHHLYSFDNIIQDTLKETGLVLYNNISDYSEKELKMLINKCLEIHYRHPLGVCLSENIHSRFHMDFGYGNNTVEQFEEFINNYYNGKYKDLLNVS